jgi:amidase
MFSLGTETDGSVIIPAERNALVGIKPTVGLTSRNGVVPETRHQDTVGVFGRSVRDAALALDGIYGVDVRDNFTAAQVGKTPDAGYAQSARGVEGLRGKRLGIPWESLWALHDPAQCRELLEILEALGKAGATIVNRTEIVDYKRLVNPTGWDWNWRGKLGLVNESEYTGKPKLDL